MLPWAAALLTWALFASEFYRSMMTMPQRRKPAARDWAALAGLWLSSMLLIGLGLTSQS